MAVIEKLRKWNKNTEIKYCENKGNNPRNNGWKDIKGEWIFKNKNSGGEKSGHFFMSDRSTRDHSDFWKKPRKKS